MATAVRRPPLRAEALVAEALRQQGAFFDAARRPTEEFLRLAIETPGGFDPLEVQKIRDAQLAYQTQFQEASAKRLRKGLQEAMRKPTRLTIVRALRARQRQASTPEARATYQAQIEAARVGPDERREHVARLLATEHRYALAHATALASRARAANRGTQVRQESPTGAFWRRNPDSDSCERCRFMDGKLWPWEVLDRFSPPVHPNCQCVLVPVGAARRNGWVGQDVPMPSVKQAVRRARRVLQESTSGAVLVEMERRGLLIEPDVLVAPVLEGLTPVFREDVHPRDLLGKFRPKLHAFLGRRPHPSAPNVLKARGLEISHQSNLANVSYRGKSREVVLRPEDPTTGLYRDLSPEEARAEVEKAISELVKIAGPKTEDTGEDNALNPARLAAVYDGFEHGGLKVRVNFARRVTSQAVELDADVISVQGGHAVGHMVRNIGVEGRVPGEGDTYAWHNIFQLDRAYQGSGLGAALSEHVENGYRDLGVKRIKLSTDDVGGYAWARAGYRTERPPETMAHLRTFDLYRVMPSPSDSPRAPERYGVPPTVPAELHEQWPAFMEFLGAQPRMDRYFGQEKQSGWSFGPETPGVEKIAAWGAENPVIIDGRQMWPGKFFLLGAKWDGVKDL